MPFFSPTSANLSLTALPHSNQLVLFMPSHHLMILIDPQQRTAKPLNIPVPGSSAFSIFGTKLYLSTGRTAHRSHPQLILLDCLVQEKENVQEELLLFYQANSNCIVEMNITTSTSKVVLLPTSFKIMQLFIPSANTWIVMDHNEQFFITTWNKVQPRKLQKFFHIAKANKNVPKYHFMSTHTSPLFLNSAESDRSYADFMDHNFETEDRHNSGEFEVLMFPRPRIGKSILSAQTAADYKEESTINERSLYLYKTDQLLTLIRSKVINGTYVLVFCDLILP